MPKAWAFRTHMFQFFERLIEPTEKPPDTPPPELGSPHALIRFYWHFVRQVPRAARGAVRHRLYRRAARRDDPGVHRPRRHAGNLADAADDVGDGGLAACRHGGAAAGAAAVAHFSQALVTNQALIPGLTNLMRWQSHWHVVRQSWTFFQNDFAGRIANRVMQTGPALRESVVAEHQRGLVHPGLRHQRGRCCSAAPTGGSRCRCCCGSRPMPCCCAISCRACASARGACRRCARRSPAASSTATPTS